MPTPAGPLSLVDIAPEDNQRYGLNDIGNGNLFADWYKEKARFVPERKQWYIYDGKVWKPDTGGLKAISKMRMLI